MNKGIEQLLKEKENKIALLLNNDTIARPDFLLHLTQCLKEESGYLLATPKILCEDKTTIWSARENVFLSAGIFFLHQRKT